MSAFNDSKVMQAITVWVCADHCRKDTLGGALPTGLDRVAAGASAVADVTGAEVTLGVLSTAIAAERLGSPC